MALGAATDLCEVKLLKAGLGLLPSGETPAYLQAHVSMTPIADDGSGATEFSGDTYVPRTVLAWTAAAGGTSGGVTTYSTRPTADITFPTPTAIWWDDNTTIYPYLTDDAGHILFWWTWTTHARVGPGAPLVLPHSGISNWVEFGLTDEGDPTHSFPATFGQRAVDGLTKAVIWAPVAQWYLGAFDEAPFRTSAEPPTYYYLSSGDWTWPGNSTPVENVDYPAVEAYHRAPVTLVFGTGGDGMGYAQNSGDVSIYVPMTSFVAAGGPIDSTGWGHNLSVILADGDLGSSTYGFGFAGLNSPAVPQGDSLSVPAGAIKVKCF